MLFYAEYNLRLCQYLLFASYDVVCSIDLDTLPAGCFATLLRRKRRVFDAHEYFTEVPEVTHRTVVKKIWDMIGRICLPFYRHAYTVGQGLADIFKKKYGLPFAVIRNVPVFRDVPVTKKEKPFILLYQGALNEGRGIETALEALQYLPDVQLWLAGEGDLSDALRHRSEVLGLGDRVRFLGFVKPAELPGYTAQAWLGINLLENKGLSYYHSLANKFFDYIQAGVPVLTMNFPEYRALNTQWEVGVLLDELQPETVANAINKLLIDKGLYQRLQENCLAARHSWNWEAEQKTLLAFWQGVCARK
jgi:glycosyltransferase involved in cell wall biosynthesis